MNKHLEEAIYRHSYDKYMNSFKPVHLSYWGRKHKLMAKALGKPNMIREGHNIVM